MNWDPRRVFVERADLRLFPEFLSASLGCSEISNFSQPGSSTMIICLTASQKQRNWLTMDRKL